jgi:peptidoglycan LD-endopeptidase LytH
LNRLGWIILIFIVAAAIAFGLLLGSVEERAPKPVVAAPEVSSSGALVVPVAGVSAEALSDTWGDSRGGGDRTHQAIDIMSPRGTPVVAAAPGVIEKLFDSRQGGHTVYVRSPDRKTVYYYAHLDEYRDGIKEGQAVRTGDVIGTVGFTGNASPEGPHLHFEVKRMRDGEAWHQGQAVNPYPLLAGKAAAR